MIALKLPEIPKDISPEMYNYYIQLHKNLKLIADAINTIHKG